VPVEPDGQGVDLPFELTEAAGQPVALFPERLGHRHDRFDEPAFAIVVDYAFAHRRRPPKKFAAQAAIRMPRRELVRTRIWRDAHVVVLTA
jgi:hypothetical protein